MKWGLLMFAICLIASCSNKGVYENMQINQRNECLKLPHSQYEECMKDVEKSFEQYEREREEVIKQ